jgi:glycosyltransferase involved in cell wall biosynthesis
VLADREGVADRIRFAGLQVDAAAWLAVMDILVCPSLQESFGLAALEAQAAGIPVIASRIDGFIEVLHDGEDALLVRPGSPASLAEAIQRVLKNGALASKLVVGGHRNMRRFTIRETARQYAALYHELLGSKRGDRPSLRKPRVK